MSLKQRVIILDHEEAMNKLANPPEQGDWLLAVDPDSLVARIVIRDKVGFVPDVLGHEDLFPLAMIIENQDGFVQGGDWLVAQTPNIPDCSVVLLRSDFVFFSEKNYMKVLKNQWVLIMLYRLEYLSGATSRGQTTAPEVQKPSQ